MAVTALQNADASKKGGIRMGKKMMHIGLEPGAVGRYVFLPGSPERTEKIAAYFDDPEGDCL